MIGARSKSSSWRKFLILARSPGSTYRIAAMAARDRRCYRNMPVQKMPGIGLDCATSPLGREPALVNLEVTDGSLQQGRNDSVSAGAPQHVAENLVTFGAQFPF